MPTPYPLRTQRLTLRMMRVADADAHAAYRNDPDVARHQLWDLPYPVSDAQDKLARQSSADDLAIGDWTTLAIELEGVVIGDVCANVHETRGVAEIGYTLASSYWGHGYATEATTALADDLVDRIGVGRLSGDLDPPNLASQRVLERVGLAFESLTRKSFLWRGEWTDNLTYAATADEYRAWRSRVTAVPIALALVPLDRGNVGSYGALRTHASQEAFVPTMAQSFADALFPESVDGEPVRLRLLGVEADGRPAGLVMVLDPIDDGRPRIHRVLIDRWHQGRAIVPGALALLAAEYAGQALPAAFAEDAAALQVPADW